MSAVIFARVQVCGHLLVLVWRFAGCGDGLASATWRGHADDCITCLFTSLFKKSPTMIELASLSFIEVLYLSLC